MFFTIEAVLPIYRYPPWQLQIDGIWKLKEDNKFIDKNKVWTTEDLNKVKKETQSNQILNIDGQSYVGNPEGGHQDLLKVYYDFDSTVGTYTRSEPYVLIRHVVNRITKPHRFTIEELKQIIRESDDEQGGILVLNTKGNFQVLPFYADCRDNPIVAVRYESFSPGNDYLGPNAAEDNSFINLTFHDMLAGWVEHLNTGFITPAPEFESKTEVELWQSVDELTLRLV